MIWFWVGMVCGGPMVDGYEILWVFFYFFIFWVFDLVLDLFLFVILVVES